MITIYDESNQKTSKKRDVNLKATEFRFTETAFQQRKHTDEIQQLIELTDSRIATCSSDSTIVISSKNNTSIKSLKGHTDEVNSICQLDDGNLVSCSRDQSIKIWSIKENSYKCIFSIDNAHEESISKVISLSNNRIASCSYDSLIKIWKSNPPYSKEPISILKGCRLIVTSILYIKKKDILISGGNYDDTIRIWSLKLINALVI